MPRREYLKNQIDILPDSVIDKIQEYIAFQKFAIGLFDNDTDYLTAIPGMIESIQEGVSTPLSECIPLSEVWPDV